jgi:hypothetical protein
MNLAYSCCCSCTPKEEALCHLRRLSSSLSEHGIDLKVRLASAKCSERIIVTVSEKKWGAR